MSILYLDDMVKKIEELAEKASDLRIDLQNNTQNWTEGKTHKDWAKFNFSVCLLRSLDEAHNNLTAKCSEVATAARMLDVYYE